jgi:hypothetical protein
MDRLVLSDAQWWRALDSSKASIALLAHTQREAERQEWWRGLAPPRLPIATAGIPAVGLVVLSQNHQPHGLPVGIVIAFLLYDQIRERFGPSSPALLVLMIFPLFAIGTSAFSLAGYHARASRDGVLQAVERRQPRGACRAAGAGRAARRFRRRQGRSLAAQSGA